jgi:hypothetical protein
VTGSARASPLPPSAVDTSNARLQVSGSTWQFNPTLRRGA